MMNGYGQFRSRFVLAKKRPYTLRLKNKASRKQDEARGNPELTERKQPRVATAQQRIA